MPLLVLLFFTLNLCLAQHSAQPAKESTSDLRSGLELFKIVSVEEGAEIWLERTASLDYFLRLKKKGNEEKIQKVTSKDAQKLDMDFASRFLKCQYELPSSPLNCKVTWKLSMKGETQDICGKDEKKSQEIDPFLKDLRKRF